ncbi:MAG: binding--dependent transport system inner rane component family protein [Gammaproteobacteria bacterium]|jgi:putrescine transport system permease protein|nr:binding--dependent transport system inner rane component family protein [Gammaproteobacteria bacterium]
MKQSLWLKFALTLGLLFLYLPIIMMIIYSFNASTLVNIWGGWTTSWYHVLAQDDDLISAALLSIQVAVTASTIALVLGTMIAVVIKRYGVFKGRNFFYGMSITPIVMPDVVTGLSLLLLFVGMNEFIGFPNSYGFITIVIGHTTFCTAYATIVIQARLGSIDRSIEEAAMDLGARPTKTFFWITLPQIASSLVAAWLLSFTLSIDNLVITSFISGPSSTTLPLFIYSTIRNGVTPEINALATIMISIVILGLVSGAWLLNKYGKKSPA